ncbi:ATP-binding protein [Thioalkalivibrio sp. ALE23]|uniref:ATP-binding protein n=1 Tax=Thioalkalivibrio sp. ALE23 TaxID=1265495 RepID=UPI00035D46CE|nr:ATP-binding protein [Thioalkalivibrio sp. ALE23]
MIERETEAHALLQISLAVGRSLDLGEMLGHALIKLVRTVNISGAIVLERSPSAQADAVQWTPVRSMPRGLEHKKRWRAVLRSPQLQYHFEPSTPLQPPSFCKVNGDGQFIVFELPEFGAIVIGDSPQSLPDSFWESFRTIATRLSDACMACRKNEQLARRQAQESLLIRWSLELARAPQDALEGVLEDSFYAVALALRADEATLCLNADDPTLCTPAVHWSTADRSRTERHDARRLPVIIPATDQDPTGPRYAEHIASESGLDSPYTALANRGIRSHVTIPLASAVGTLGFVTLNWRSPAYNGQRPDENFLRLIANLFTSAKLRLDQQSRLQALELQLRAESRSALSLAQKAEKANHAKSRFLAVVSHELRTPLTSALTTLELLADTQLDADQRARVETLLRASNHMNQIVNDLLDLSAIENGTVELQESPAHLPTLLRELVDQMAAMADDKGNQLLVEIDPELPDSIYVDQRRFRQILWNLLGNALKFTRDGTVSMNAIATGSTTHDHASGRLQIKVSDTGEGLPQSDQERLFEPFYQAQENRKKPKEGIGLGLAIVDGLVRAMGGVLDFDSTPGRGSTFHFDLPLKPVGDSEPASPAPSRPHTQAVTTPDDTRILLVDDDVDVREAAEDTLRQLGYDVSVATDGQQACERIALQDYDLILMDCRMPVKDGFQATREIRGTLQEQPHRPRPVIVALTAAVMTDDRDECLAAGMDDILPKPYNRQKLKVILARWIA